jgi:lysophospholipase L1-like esterase
LPLPPVHRFPGLPQPLRWIAGEDARRHDEALSRWVRTRCDVSRPDVPLPLVPDAMAADGFHPGAPVYRACAEAVARHVASRVWPAGAAHADHPDPEGDPR